MFIAIIPLLVCIIGLLIYVLSSNVKVTKIGEHMFWTGLLVTLFIAGGKQIRLM
jgi:hypothetical protein